MTIDISILFWNIHSIEYKLLEPDLQIFLSQFDIICICESWLSDLVDNSEKISLPGYDFSTFSRTKTSVFGRNSGGLVILWKQHMNIQFIESSSEHCLFRLEDTVYLFIYAMPANSSRSLNNRDTINIMESLMYRYQDENMCIMGDLNGRTGEKEHIYGNTTVCKRISMDKNINTQGRKLIDVLNATGYCIANGRINPTESSKYTFQSSNGQSVIDYVLIKPEKLNYITNLRVHDDRTESDHFPLSFCFTAKQTGNKTAETGRRDRNNSSTKRGKIVGKNQKLYWNSDAAENFRHTLQNALEEPLPFNLDNMVEHVNKAFYTSAVHMKPTLSGKVNTISHPWFDGDCAAAKLEMTNAFKRKRRTSAQSIIEYTSKRKLYVDMKKRKKRVFNKKYIRNLIEDKRSNPKKFWKALQWKQKSPSIGATKEGLQAHFKNIYEFPNPSMDLQWETYIEHYNQWWDSNGPEHHSDILDKEICEAEIQKNVAKLQSGKAPGIDRLPSEFLKNSSNVSISALKTIFNEILNTGQYPAIWQRQLLTPIFKKGLHSEPNNYRGISLISNFSKIFLYLLYARIEKYCSTHRLVCEEQGGYKKGRWTIDNAFNLYCQIKVALSKKNGHLYVLFIDFSKCFDMISRNGLWYKLVKAGLSKKCIQVLKAIYSKVIMHLKYGDEVGDEISSRIGLKQGCPLSGILYTLYSSDCVEALCDGLDPVNKNSTYGTLMFADDTAIFARNAQTMKVLVKNLEQYTSKWGFNVNMEKTKMVLFRSKKLNPDNLLVNFTFRNERIAYEDTYRYLGLNFHYTGLWTNHIQENLSKGNRLSLVLREKVKKISGLPTKDTVDLFKSCVQSSIIYGCEIWGTTSIGSLETIQTRFAKIILGVRKTTPNCGALSELGLLPYRHFMVYRIIKYWLRLVTENLPLQREAYWKLLSCKNKNWTTFVRGKLQGLGFHNVWLNQGTENPELFLRILLERIKECYIQEFDQITRSTSRLNVLNRIKTNPCRISQYLTLNLSPCYHKILSRLRLSSHSLGIETGRWHKPIIPKENRICSFCDLGEIDDEIHFLFKCSNEKLCTLRRCYIRTFSDSVEENLVAILCSNDVSTLRKLAIYCNQAERVRSDFVLETV